MRKHTIEKPETSIFITFIILLDWFKQQRITVGFNCCLLLSAMQEIKQRVLYARRVLYLTYPPGTPQKTSLKHDRKWSTDPKTVLKILHSCKELEISGGFISNGRATDGWWLSRASGCHRSVAPSRSVMARACRHSRAFVDTNNKLSGVNTQ